MGEAGQQSSTIEEGVRIRRWRRLDEPSEGWWPWGWLPLLGLLLLLLFTLAYWAKAGVEASVEREAQTRLDEAGYKWATVTADGQEVLVTGTTTGAVNEDVLAAIARTTDCSTWAGRLSCPTRVRVEVRSVPPPPPPLPPRRPHDFMFDLSQGIVTLKGEVPTEQDRRRLVEAARSAFGRVDDRLTVTNGRPTDSYQKAYTTALDLLKLLVTGKTEWLAGVFGASGVVVEGKQAEVDALLAKFAGESKGEISLIQEAQASACDEDFAAQLQTKIQFATASSVIRAASMGLLRQLATIARRCPVTLQIEGHTDSTGTVDYNDRLSRERAESVKRALEDMQIEADRLVAIGFGQHKPIGNNKTRRGRAANRRIEIKIRR